MLKNTTASFLNECEKRFIKPRNENEGENTMSKENVEVVKKLFEAVERRDRTWVLGAYDENIRIREADSLPYGGEYHGLEGALEHAQGYRKVWDNLQTAAERNLSPTFLDAGDTVVVLWRQRAANGKQKFDSSAASVYKLRDGKIIESEMFQDTAAVLQFLDSGEIENAD